MLRVLSRLTIALIAVFGTAAVASVLLLIVLGSNYDGNTTLEDLRVNFGLSFVFAVSSGYAIVVVWRYVVRPPLTGKNLSIALLHVVVHVSIFFIFIGMEARETVVLAGIGAISVLLAEGALGFIWSRFSATRLRTDCSE